jgi:CDP-diacylglycerol--serine O-phosphatidyltransferase
MPASTTSAALSLPRAPWGFFHPSNALTYTVAVVGVVAIRGFLQGRVWQAGAALALASLLDLLDGMFAQRFHRTDAQKRFGAQIDSLSDAFAFGALPVTLFAMVSKNAVNNWWILSAPFYLVCALTRLGYYNLQTEERGGFVGIPTTIMGLLYSFILCFRLSSLTTAAILVMSGIAMVAPIRIPRPKLPVFIGVVAIGVLLLLWHLSNGLFSQTH